MARQARSSILGAVSGDGLLALVRETALREKVGPNQAETKGPGGPEVEGDNEVWSDLTPQPEGKILPICAPFVA